MKKLKLLFFWLIAINSYAQFGVITADSSTFHGNIRFKSYSLNIDSKYNGADFSFYINDLPSIFAQNNYLRKKVGGISMNYSNGIGMYGMDKNISLSSTVTTNNNTVGKSYYLVLNQVGVLTLYEQSFNSTVKFVNHGYTKLGQDAPAIKMKKITATTSNIQGGSVSVNTDIPLEKILSVQILAEYGTFGHMVPPNYDANSGYKYNYFVGGSTNNATITVLNAAGSSNQILSKPIKILLTYEE